MCLFAKRLEDGKFRWPKPSPTASLRLTAAQLAALLEGLDWRRVHEPRETRRADRPQVDRREGWMASVTSLAEIRM